MDKTHEHKSYLDRITFDPKLGAGVIAKFVTNIRIVLLLVISIAFLGIFSYLNLPQRLNPEIKIPIVIVSTVLPGAGPDDVEKLVTIPIEEKLRGLSGLDTISSVSQENFSVITMQFFNSVGQDPAKALVKDAVDSVSGLPEDANDPQVAALDFENQPIWQFAITSPSDPVSLFTFSKKLQDDIKNIPNVDRVTIRGLEEQEVAIDISPEKVAESGLNPIQLSGVLKTALGAYPSGSIDTSRNTFALTIDPSINSIEGIRKTKISIGAVDVQLGDIATVYERSKGNQTVSYLASPQDPPRVAVTFAVYKRSNADIIKTAEQVRKIVDAEIEKTDNRFVLTDISNTGELIKTQFSDLLGEFRSTILLVFATLFLFLGLRQAIISSITVPLTFLSAFVFMSVFGMSINFLSLFAFLLALGLLVDDTIVVVSAMTTYYKTGKFTPAETGLLVWRDTIVPIWSTTITTIWSFVPLLLSSGIIGEFIKPIPVVVTVTMISSTAIAVLITLPVMIVLLKPKIPGRVIFLGKLIGVLALIGVIIAIAGSNILFLPITIAYLVFVAIAWRVRRIIAAQIKQTTARIPGVHKTWNLLGKYASHGVISVDGFAQAYERFITRILKSKSARRNVVIAIVAYAVFAFALLPMGLIQNEFFPKSEADQVYINLELPSGTLLEHTKQETETLLERFRQNSHIDYVVGEVGNSNSGNGFGGGSEQTNIALFTFHLPEKEKRTADSIKIAEELRKQVADYPNGKLSVLEESGGPPAGAELQLKLSGDDLGELNLYADKVAEFLRTQPGVVNIEKSIKPGTSALVFVPDQDRLLEHGLAANSIGLWLRTAVSGFTLGEVNFEEQTTDKKNVVFSFGLTRQTPESLGRLQIPTQQGPVSLSSLGTFKTQASPTLITREQGKRTISVSAGVSRGYSATELNTKLLDFSKTVELPTGYEWKTGGVNEENAKSVQSILQAMVVAFILILVTMVIQFQSFRQAVIVLLVIPLAVSSVFLIFALTGTPLSFPALIGVLSLFGIVVTNSMFIVDKINLNRKEGMPFIKAIADAGSSRMEPIILTKLCTVFGLLPITLADPLWRGLGGAIISGLLIASTIMLLFIPVVYYAWMKPAENSDL